MAKTRPILFKGGMVNAIFSGHKTSTRRIVKPDWRFNTMTRSVWDYLDDASELDVNKALHYCPHGRAGDKLWVRETWCHKADPATGKLLDEYHYQADGYEVRHVDGGQTEAGHERSPWRPSIYMPREACRLVLTIERVAVERLQTITGPDAFDEMGLDPEDPDLQDYVWEIREFAKLWDGINAKRGFGWDTNPWVWVIHFRVEEGS